MNGSSQLIATCSWTAVVRGALMKGLAGQSVALERVKIESRSARKHYGAESDLAWDDAQHSSLYSKRCGIQPSLQNAQYNDDNTLGGGMRLVAATESELCGGTSRRLASPGSLLSCGLAKREFGSVRVLQAS